MLVSYHIRLPAELCDDTTKMLAWVSNLLPSPTPTELHIHVHPPTHVDIEFDIDHASPLLAAQAIVNAMKGQCPT